MTKGVALSKELRELVHHSCCVLGMGPQQIFDALFMSEPTRISMAHLYHLCSFFAHGQPLAIETYLVGPAIRPKHRKRRFGDAEKGYLRDMVERRCHYRVRVLRAQFIRRFYADVNDGPSLSSVQRMLKEFDFTRKVIERMNVRQDPIERMEYWNRIAAFDPVRIIDTDGISCRPEDIEQKYGWALRGEPATKLQFVLGGKTYSVMASYTPVGFLAWGIYEGAIDADTFQEYLRQELRPRRKLGWNVGIFDNARIHKAPKSLRAIDEVFGGMYDFCAAYSPDLKPCERGFSNVRNYLREHEDEAMHDHLGWLNHAFWMHSMWGPRADRGSCYMQHAFLDERTNITP
jgi:transposase